MSGLALLMKKQGYTVSGCDTDISSAPCQQLIYEECTIYGGHHISHLKAAQVIVYTSAYKKTDEVSYAKSHNNIVISHAELLGQLLRQSYGIVVAGSHGKTMAAGLTAYLLRSTGYHPRFLVNGIMRNYRAQACFGDGAWFVAQARKSDPSLLHLPATLALITGVDDEHVTKHQDKAAVTQSLDNFLQQLPFYGIAVICKDNVNTKTLRNAHQHHAITYGFDRHADMYAEIVTLGAHHSIFNVFCKTQGLLGTITLPVPGMQTVQSALGALTICHNIIGIPFKKLAPALQRFEGIERRFEHLGTFNNADIFDDCSDHPGSIDAILTTAYNATRKNLHVVFQPEHPTRLDDLWQEFQDVFARHADQIKALHFLPFLPQKEEAQLDLTICDFTEHLSKQTGHKNIYCYQQAEEVIDALASHVEAFDLVITIGPKEVRKLSQQLIKKKRKN